MVGNNVRRPSLRLLFGYGTFYNQLTLEQYEILTNVWHVGIILLIFLVPARLKQNNLT